MEIQGGGNYYDWWKEPIHTVDGEKSLSGGNGTKRKAGNDMEDTTGNERSLYGREWNHVHHGYFSDPAVAAPLLEMLIDVVDTERPSVVADLGGGTGYILDRLVGLRGTDGITFINVDVSADQLHQTLYPSIKCISCSLEKISREDFSPADGPLLMCMRSVLHYFGREGLAPILRHLRTQSRSGEYLIHQTACFEDRRDQEVMNFLYQGMGTGKWYPTVDELTHALEREGWEVHRVSSAPSLVLPKEELEERYKVSEMEMAGIRKEITRKGEPSPAVFISSEQGFTAYLHYHVFKCEAV